MEKSAVEWLVNELKENIGLKDLHAIEKAKQMEKQQHEGTWYTAHQAGRFEGKGIAEENWQTFEEHWEKTFKSE